MKFCRECGSSNDDASLFCYNCGTKFSDESVAKNESTQQQEAYEPTFEDFVNSEEVPEDDGTVENNDYTDMTDVSDTPGAPEFESEPDFGFEAEGEPEVDSAFSAGSEAEPEPYTEPASEPEPYARYSHIYA